MPRVNGRRIISGIIFVIRNGLRWRDAPADYGRPKTIYNRFIRRGRLGMFKKIFECLEEVCYVTGWWRRCNDCAHTTASSAGHHYRKPPT